MFGFHCYAVSLGASKITDKDKGTIFIYIPLRVLKEIKIYFVTHLW